MKSGYDKMMKIFEDRGLDAERRILVPQASGSVLEIGVGTGVNLKYYDKNVIQQVIFTDYDLNDIVKHKIEMSLFDIPHEIQMVDVMALPFESNSFDTVVSTLVFCSVKDVEVGLKEIKRVLKDNGRLIFIEHVIPEHKGLKLLFNGLTPVWKRLAGNCHLNRDYLHSLLKVGFTYKLSKRFIKTTFISGIAAKKI